MRIFVKKAYTRYFTLVICMLFVLDVYGGELTTGWVNIQQIELGWYQKRVNFLIEQEIPNPAACQASQKASINEDQVNLEYVYALALASFSAHKEVQLVISDNSCAYNGLRKIISMTSKY